MEPESETAKGFLGLAIIAGSVWLFFLIINNWRSTLEYGSLALLAFSFATIVRGYVTAQHTSRKRLLWSGTLLWIVITMALSGFFVMEADRPIIPVISLLLTSGLALALVHGVGLLAGRCVSFLDLRHDRIEGHSDPQFRSAEGSTVDQDQRAEAEARRQREEAEENAAREEARLEAERQERRRREQQAGRENARRQSARSFISSVTTEEQALDVLELRKPFTRADLNARRKTMLLKVHPDHGGSTYMTRLVNEAYVVLEPLAHR